MPAPFSVHYDDVYFSAADGLAEKRYVFLGGNHLPAAWQNRDDFVIAEAGFGTGLSFLAAAQSFLATTGDHQRLHFISFEAHPLSNHEICAALNPWANELGDLIDDLAKVLPRPIPGMHRVFFRNRIILTLVYGDINATLPFLDLSVDAWFLDGFNPAKNPDMWSDAVFSALGNLSVRGATAATYSAARVVKDGLARAGFTVTRQQGFGYKSDMVVGTKNEVGRNPLITTRGRRVAVLGGGLAGTAVAWALKKLGQEPIIVAPHGLADGASGNRQGLYNPRFTKQWDAPAMFYASAFARFQHFITQADVTQTGWLANGALHLLHDPEQSERLRAMPQAWGWGDDDAHIIDANAVQTLAGIVVPHSALWLPHAGSVDPGKMCHLYAQGIEVRSDQPGDVDDVILANGIAALEHPRLATFPLHTVRGQISYVRANDRSRELKTNLCYGGYLAPAVDGIHVVGATFQRWSHDPGVLMDDHAYIIDKLNVNVSPIFHLNDVTGGRAGFRVASPDRAPVIGKITQNDGAPLYMSLAHGSHGLLSTHLAAWFLAEKISAMPMSLLPGVDQWLDPQRLLAKALSKP